MRTSFLKLKNILVLSVMFTLFSVLINKANADINTSLCLRDCKMEYNFFKKYSREGSSIANLALSIMNYRGQGTEVNVSAGNQYLVKSARAGEPAVQYQLGYFLMEGTFMPQDLNAALGWFKKSSRYHILDSQQKVAELTHRVAIYEAPTMTPGEGGSFFIKGDLAKRDDNQLITIKMQQAEEVPVDMERITIVASFSWSDVLAAAKQQTCNTCNQEHISKAIMPIIRFKNKT